MIGELKALCPLAVSMTRPWPMHGITVIVSRDIVLIPVTLDKYLPLSLQSTSFVHIEVTSIGRITNVSAKIHS